MKISKEYKNEYGERMVKIGDWEYVIDGDKLRVNFDVRDFREGLTFDDEDKIAEQATVTWKNNLDIKLSAKKIAIEKKTVSHWYNRLTDSEKERICRPLSEKIEKVVERFVTSNPNCKLNEYYLTIPERCKYRNPVFPRVTNKKLVGLPQYIDASCELMGNDLSFIQLAALIYPPLGKINRGNRLMSEL